MSDKVTSEEVADAFEEFVSTYESFRESNGLKKGIPDPYEMLVAMSDKHGRVCRQIKHYERDEPKSDWPNAVGEAFTGYIIYMIMVLRKYNIKIAEGMAAELESSARQHAQSLNCDNQE